jgi:hypothetical protein
MDEITCICLQCRARVTLPMPDMLQTPDGEILDARELAGEVATEALRDYMHNMPCPSCGGELRITLPA